MTKRIVMYRTTSCPFCVQAERFLAGKGVSFEQVFLDDHPDRRGFTNSILPGHRTVPLVVVDDQPIGGMSEMATLDRSGKLDELLGASADS
jgi:glutaredoxin 3